MISMLTDVLDHLVKVLDDYKCGKHSNFPTCCNLAFSIGDSLSSLHKSRYYRYRRAINVVVSRVRRIEWGYIPCPICLFISNPVKVMKCDCKDNVKLMKLRRKVHNSTNRSKQNTKVCRTTESIDKIMDSLLNDTVFDTQIS